MKRIIAIIVLFIMLLTMLSPISVIADSSDAAIQSKIDELWNMLGGTYFTKDRSTGCGVKSSGHGCNNCYTPNIVEASWFKNLFGNVSTNQFPYTYYNNGEEHGRAGWSCFGFASFAEWYIFKSSNSDTVNTYHAGTKKFNYSNVSAYAKKGDLIRLHNGNDGGHSVIFISADSTGIQVIHSNYGIVGVGYNCLVRKDNIKYTSDYGYFTISRAENRNIITEPPSNPWIKVDKYNVSTNSDLTFTYNADNSNEFELWLFKDGICIGNTKLPSGGNYTIKFDSSGYYQAYVSCSNEYGYIDSSKIEFNIYDNVPPDPWIYAEQSSVQIGECVRFVYNASYVTRFSLGIDRYGERVLSVSRGWNDTTYTTSFDTPGTYTAYISAYNDYGYADSRKITFTVHDKNVANIGETFYGKILNKACWKPINNNNSIVRLCNEQGHSNELWKFVRQSDGSYEIISCYNGEYLITEKSDNEAICSIITGVTSDISRKQWFIYNYGNGVLLRPKCSDYVLTLENNSAIEGTAIKVNSLNGENSQIFNVYQGYDVQLTAPILKIEKTNYDNIYFHWNQVSAATKYKINIYKKEDLSNPIYVDDVGYNVTSYKAKLPSGSYVATVRAYNYFEGGTSNEVSFDAITPISVVTCKTGDKLNFAVSMNLSDAEGSAVLIGIYDKNNKLIDFKKEEYNHTLTFNTDYNVDIACAKIYAWNSMSLLEAICEEKMVVNSEFITE